MYKYLLYPWPIALKYAMTWEATPIFEKPLFKGSDYDELSLTSLISFYSDTWRNKQIISREDTMLVSISHETDSIVRDCCSTPNSPSPLFPYRYPSSIPLVILPRSARLRSNDDCILGLWRNQVTFQNPLSVHRTLWEVEHDSKALSSLHVGKLLGDVCNQPNRHFELEMNCKKLNCKQNFNRKCAMLFRNYISYNI